MTRRLIFRCGMVKTRCGERPTYGHDSPTTVGFGHGASVDCPVNVEGGGLGSDSRQTVVGDAREAADVLVTALGTSVVDVLVNDVRSFSFENELSLRVIDENKELESSTVNHSGPLIVV